MTTSLITFTSDAAGFDSQSCWLDTGREVVVFDAQFTEELAGKLIAEIRGKTPHSIRFVVVTGRRRRWRGSVRPRRSPLR
jgi:hypothetical protein